MTSVRRILILGGGFAGLWSALAAARAREALSAQQIEIVLLNDTPWHSIRVRNYEADLSQTRVALDEVLQRFPSWEVDQDHAVQARTSTVRGWERLPVVTG